MNAISDSLLSHVSLGFLRRRRRLLFHDFDYLARIRPLIVLEHEVLGFERIALIIELDRAGDPSKILDAPHGGGDLGPAWPLAAVGFEPLFHRLNAYQGGVVAVHRKGLDVTTETLLEFLGKGRAFRISIRRASDSGIITASHCAATDIHHLRRIQAVWSHEPGFYTAFAELL